MNSMTILAATGTSSWIMIAVLAVVMVGMMLLSVIPQKKRQKKAQEMMSAIKVGSKVKTIGGFIGTVKMIDNVANTFALDISSKEDGSTLVTIDKTAIYTVLTPNTEGVLEPAQPEVVMAADDAEADAEAKAKAEEKKNNKKAKKVAANENEKENIEGNNDITFEDNNNVKF